MTITLVGERHFQVLSTIGQDIVCAAFDLPAGSVLKKISCTMDIVGTLLAHEREDAVGYAAAAYLVGLRDPDTAVPYDTIWDRFVPKYTRTEVIDLDTGSADATPFWEPGEASFEEVFDMGNMPRRLWMRRKTMTFADPGSAGLKFRPAETPFEPQWFASDIAHFRLNKPIRVSRPSVVMIGFASPNYDATTTSRAHLLEAEWGQIQYVESTLERALVNQLVVQEAGAETPWEESSLLLRKHLAPDIFEMTTNAFLNEAYRIFGHLEFEHTVPGTLDFDRIDLTP